MERLTPNQARKRLCVQCIGGPQLNSREVENCRGDEAKTGACPIYPYRMGKRMSVKVLRKFCLNCMGGNRVAVSECITETCPAHPYRFGKNPGRAGVGADHLQKHRETVADAANIF